MIIKYNIHVKNQNEWPKISDDGQYVGNYIEWEANDWIASNGELPEIYERYIDGVCQHMTNGGLGFFQPNEVISQRLDTDRVDKIINTAYSRHVKAVAAGKKGAKNKWAKTTPEERSKIASDIGKLGAKKRWSK